MNLQKHRPPINSFSLFLHSYLMTSGLIERVSRHSRASIESDFWLEQDRESPLLVSSYDLLSRICVHLRRQLVDVPSPDSPDSSATTTTTTELSPPTARAHLLSLLGASEAAGVVGALYAAIALPGGSSGSASGSTGQQKTAASPTPSQPGLTAPVKSLAVKGLALLRNLAELDLPTLQVRRRSQ